VVSGEMPIEPGDSGVLIEAKCIQGIDKKKEDSARGQFFKTFDCVIFDEVHMFMSKEFIKNIIACDSTHIIALSATPSCKFSDLGINPFRQFRDVYVVEKNAKKIEHMRAVELVHIEGEVPTPTN
jgi:superfamily II DNA or RNA helicase